MKKGVCVEGEEKKKESSIDFLINCKAMTSSNPHTHTKTTLACSRFYLALFNYFKPKLQNKIHQLGSWKCSFVYLLTIFLMSTDHFLQAWKGVCGKPSKQAISWGKTKKENQSTMVLASLNRKSSGDAATSSLSIIVLFYTYLKDASSSINGSVCWGHQQRLFFSQMPLPFGAMQVVTREMVFSGELPCFWNSLIVSP